MEEIEAKLSGSGEFNNKKGSAIQKEQPCLINNHKILHSNSNHVGFDGAHTDYKTAKKEEARRNSLQCDSIINKFFDKSQNYIQIEQDLRKSYEVNSPYFETQRYEHGNRYEGKIINNIREGFGVYYFNSGSKYEGYWKNNVFDGIGEMQYYNGNRYLGEWK